MIECKKPYLPAITTSGQSILVVEGAINTGSDSTIIRLSRTIPISSPEGSLAPPELNAKVVIQSDASATYPLTSKGNGYYFVAGLSLSTANKYRLQITTADNKIYQSDFVAAKNALPIDSIGFNFTNSNVNINVSTHDPSNNTHYYRWDYTETWIIHAKYESFLIAQKEQQTIIQRPPDQQIYTCWQTHQSSSIVLGTTAKLKSDVLANAPVTTIASSSEKLTSRYSILVRQYALTPDAYNYYVALKKNTEQLGAIFDPQPSILTGNVYCITNPAEQVIGYITAGSVTQKRIYINRQQLPEGEQWRTVLPYDPCILDTTYFVDFRYRPPINTVDRDIFQTGDIPVDPIGPPGSPPIGFTASSGICVDCTLRGTNKQPAFWTDQ